MKSLEEILIDLDKKYQPKIQKKEVAKIAADIELRDIQNEYSEKKIRIEEYYKALEDKERIDDIISKEITI